VPDLNTPWRLLDWRIRLHGLFVSCSAVCRISVELCNLELLGVVCVRWILCFCEAARSGVWKLGFGGEATGPVVCYDEQRQGSARGSPSQDSGARGRWPCVHHRPCQGVWVSFLGVWFHWIVIRFIGLVLVINLGLSHGLDFVVFMCSDCAWISDIWTLAVDLTERYNILNLGFSLASGRLREDLHQFGEYAFCSFQFSEHAGRGGPKWGVLRVLLFSWSLSSLIAVCWIELRWRCGSNDLAF